MATGNSYAKLATRQDLDAIASTLANQPDRNLGYVSRILQKQEEQPEENRRESGSFVVVANNGSSNNSVFAIASDAYSTFDGCMRTDVRIYLPEVFSALPSKTRKSQMTALMRGVSKEVANRKWRGPVHIEFANNTNGLDNDDMAVEKKKVAAATAVLKELGGKPLIHSGDPMVPLILSGKRYVVAVIRAAENSPQQPLGSTAQKRLKEAARRYGLEYSPAA